MIGSFEDMEKVNTQKGMIHVVSLPKGSIHAVYLGVRVEQQHIVPFQDLLAKPEHAATNLFKTDTDPKHFDVKFTSITAPSF